MNTGAFVPATQPNDEQPPMTELELARLEGAKAERLRQTRVTNVALLALRVVTDDARHLASRLPADEQRIAKRIESSIEGVMESLRDMRPKFA